MTDRQKHFCDVARVEASGVPELTPGQIVLLMAGTGLYLTDSLSERIVGTGPHADLPRGDDQEPEHPDHWFDVIPARLEGLRWVLSPGWFWARKLPQGRVLLAGQRNDVYRVSCPELLGFEGGYIDLTQSEMLERGWELFALKRTGSWERYLVNAR